MEKLDREFRSVLDSLYETNTRTAVISDIRNRLVQGHQIVSFFPFLESVSRFALLRTQFSRLVCPRSLSPPNGQRNLFETYEKRVEEGLSEYRQMSKREKFAKSKQYGDFIALVWVSHFLLSSPAAHCLSLPPGVGYRC